MQVLKMEYSDINKDAKTVTVEFNTYGSVFAKLHFDFENDKTKVEGSLLKEIPFDSEEQHEGFINNIRENARIILSRVR